MLTFSIGKSKRVYATTFSPSGRFLAAVGLNRVHVWDTLTGEVRKGPVVEETSSGYDLEFLDETRLLFAGTDLRVWDLAADTWQVLMKGMRWSRQVTRSPDGLHLAEADQTTSTDWGGAGLALYDAATGDLLPAPPAAGHTTGGLAFSPDGRSLATGHIVRVGEKTRHIGLLNMDYQVNDYDYVVHIREMPSCRVVATIPGWGQGVRYLAYSPDGTRLAGTAGPRLRVWDLANNREVAVQKRGPKHFQGLAFTADGRHLATVSNDTTVRLWDAQTWAERTAYTWAVGALLNLALAPDGLRAAAGSDRGKVVVWDMDV
jgi:WD40 repeat protein